MLELFQYVIISALLITVGSSPGTGNFVHPLHRSALSAGRHRHSAGGEVRLLMNMNMTAIIMSTLLMSLMKYRIQYNINNPLL